MPEVKTLVIDNFRGSLTQFVNGDIKSGFSSLYESAGQDPFSYPGRLRWTGSVTRIDSDESVITDLIMDGKVRSESGIIYTYAIGHTGRLYKIQSNDPTTFNPDYDNPTLLTTLTAQSPTFTKGGFMAFFGSTEQIYIGHDKGVTRVNFDGTGETFVGALGSWTQNVPRPLGEFLGKLYAGNGTNLAEISSGATVSTYSVLSPAFPINTEVRDLDVSPDGSYLETVVSGLPLQDMTTNTQETSRGAKVESYLFRWNGTDATYTSFLTYPNLSLTANTLFGDLQYVFGYDQNGGAIFDPVRKVLSLQEVVAPFPNAIGFMGSMMTFIAPVYYDGALEAEFFAFGPVDFENPLALYNLMFNTATGSETDVLRIPCQIPVSNFGVGSSSNGYTDNEFSSNKIYFSTLETSGAPTTKYKLYKWNPLASPFATGTPLDSAIYQTQNQLFSKKIAVKEVRVYGEPWATGMAFTIDLIGSGGTASFIANGSKSFTIGDGLTAGDDFAWYNPDIAPTYSLAVRVTNDGTTNFTINKIEVDWVEAGK